MAVGCIGIDIGIPLATRFECGFHPGHEHSEPVGIEAGAIGEGSFVGSFNGRKYNCCRPRLNFNSLA